MIGGLFILEIIFVVNVIILSFWKFGLEIFLNLYFFKCEICIIKIIRLVRYELSG